MTRKDLTNRRSLAKQSSDLVRDIQVFDQGVKEEFEARFFDGYKDRLTEFNGLLERAHRLALAEDILLVQPVGPDHDPWPAHASETKKAKLREIANSARRLRARAEAEWPGMGAPLSEPKELPVLRIERIANRLHKVAIQIRSRHDGRPTLDVSDEYDVQDLLHSLLVVDFDDVRPEEYTPSYAGGASRTDFLLKKERIVIEVKKSRNGMTANSLGQELLVDIARYGEHPDCGALICIIYDPDSRIANPRGLEADLEKRSSRRTLVRVMVRPIA